MKVGVLGLQGDIREHCAALNACGVETTIVRRSEEIENIDALVIPGGESTTIAQLAQVFGIFDLLKERIASGLPTYGSCAGMILLADRILGAAPDQRTFGGLDITVKRNAFGRQVDSFEADIDFSGLEEPMKAVFIRAPWVESVAAGVETLASVKGSDGAIHPVAIRNETILATSFHPELTSDYRIHRYFIDEVCKPKVAIR
ncbi:MAG: pyridoxal 5'-phosphate synthase glutaminase subunit PdxT [Actinomycetota bacterium]